MIITIVIDRPGPLYGASISIHQCGSGLPPDRAHLMAPASCSTWIRFDSHGPSGWWRPVLRSQHKIRAWLATVNDVAEIVRGTDLWYPLLSPPHDNGDK